MGVLLAAVLAEFFFGFAQHARPRLGVAAQVADRPASQDDEAEEDGGFESRRYGVGIWSPPHEQRPQERSNDTDDCSQHLTGYHGSHYLPAR